MTTFREPAPYGGPGTYEPDLYPGDGIDADDYQPQHRGARSRVAEATQGTRKSRADQWMEQDFKFGGSRVKRKTVALVLMGAPAVIPLIFMLPSFFTLNSNTVGVAGDDVLGTGAELCLFLCLTVTPMITLTGSRWYFPLRRWYGVMMAPIAFADTIGAGLTDSFAGGFFGRVAGHVFELMGFFMACLLVPLLITSNHWAQRKLGRYWRPLQRLTYVIWGLLFCHLALLEGFGFENGNTNNGSGFPGDGDPVFHQRLYQYSAASLFLLTLRLPPVKRWISARQKEGRNWLVYATVLPIFALFIFGMTFMFAEEVFKGMNAFRETPSVE
jgi:DMSO/TMAO reductase YedYZ heme-binding membrane subunit